MCITPALVTHTNTHSFTHCHLRECVRVSPSSLKVSCFTMKSGDLMGGLLMGCRRDFFTCTHRHTRAHATIINDSVTCTTPVTADLSVELASELCVSVADLDQRHHETWVKFPHLHR